MKRIIATLAVISLLAGTVVVADSAFAAEKRNAKKSEKSDRSKKYKSFDDCDTNGDKVLSLKEYEACHPQLGEERFRAIDTNNDGKITKEENSAFEKGRNESRKRAFFDSCDTDKSGHLSFEEFNQCLSNNKKRPSGGKVK